MDPRELRPFRKSLVIRMRINDGPDGEERMYRVRAGYCDEFYRVAEISFHAPREGGANPGSGCGLRLGVQGSMFLPPGARTEPPGDTLTGGPRGESGRIRTSASGRCVVCSFVTPPLGRYYRLAYT